MKRIINLVWSAALLLAGVCACQPTNEEPLESVDLRYRVEDSYDLAARNAQPFAIVITSTAPWMITSEHPDWCIITQEEGDASDPELVHIGQGEKTTVRVQYYDNLQLDDRTDLLTIKSDIWVAKTVKVTQKGIAYLTIPEEEQSIAVTKDGGNYEFHVNTNQKWSAQITNGDWIEFVGPAQGENDGVVTIKASQNAAEQRYAAVTVYDRKGVEMQTVNFTQDGVQLDPASLEIRASYDQTAASLDVIANAKWKAVKENPEDTWFTIVNPTFDGNGTMNITLTENTGTGLRTGRIIIESISDDPDAFTAKRTIVLKQGYKVNPVRKEFDNDEMSKWKSDWTNTPVYTKGVGTLFTSKARLNNGDMPYGTYTFRWSSIDPAARVRLWFCYSDSQEIKFNINEGKASLDWNCGNSAKPSISYDAVKPDLSQPVDMTLRFEASGDKYCRVIYYINGVEIGTFESSDDVMNMVLAGKDVNMYVGVDTAGSAICEWYEYTAPVNWDE